MGNTISSTDLEKVLNVNSKAIELQTIVHSQFEDITETLDTVESNQAKIESKLDEQDKKISEIDKKIFKLNLILGSNLLGLIVGIIILIVKLILGAP